MPPAQIPAPQFDTIGHITQILRQMLGLHEPVLMGHAWRIFLLVAVIMIVWDALKAAFVGQWIVPAVGRRLVQFVLFSNLLLYYNRPIPGIGYSFTGLFLDEFSYLLNLFDARSMATAFTHMEELLRRVVMPNLFSGGPFVAFIALTIIVWTLKGQIFFVVGGSMIKSAVLVVLGPLALALSMLDGLSWIFPAWFRAFLQHSFVPVVAAVYLYVFANFTYLLVAWVPLTVPVSQYPLYVYASISLLLTFVFCFWSINALTADFFSGHMHSGGDRSLSSIFRV